MLCPRLACRLILVLILAAAAPAAAQEVDEAAPELSGPEIPLPEAAPPPGIEAIEVTGERLNDANVQDEAQAITAFTAEDLDRANIVDVNSLAGNVPGLHVGQSASAPIITLRGIGTENASLTGEPGVAFHIDGINMGRPAAARVAFFDLETLDVKRGPQGLLGGKNSTSGSINLISKKPTDEYEVGGDVLMGNYDRVRLRGHVNVPLGEFVSTRLALYSETRDGFLDNVLVDDSRDPFDADEFGLRAQMRVTPAESLDLIFSYNYFKQDGVGPQADAVPIPRTHECRVLARTVDVRGVAPGQYGTLIIGNLPPVLINSSLPVAAACNTIPGYFTGQYSPPPQPSQLFNNPLTGEAIYGRNRQGRLEPGNALFDPAPYDDSDPRSIYLDSETQQQNRYWGWTTTADWEAPELPLLGATQVKLLGGFQRTEQNFTQDFDATDRPLSQYTLEPDNADQYSGELQWNGTGFAERLDWQASLFHLHEKGDRTVDSPTLTQPDGGLLSEQTTDNKAYGAALHGGYQVLDSLRFNLGGRFIKDRKITNLFRVAKNSGDRFRGCTGSLGDITGEIELHVPLFPSPDCEETYRGTAWGTGLEWRPLGDDHLLYAKLDRGYKSGGFRAGTIGEYAPEKIWAYALGTKSEFFDQRLRVNLEGFFYAYDALQLVILDGLALRTENADARMYGWDLETLASPIDGLNLSAVVSFLKTEALEYQSLDPTIEPPGAFFNYAAYESWHSDRLFEREEAEAAAVETGLSGPLTNYATRNCVMSPSPNSGNLTTECGRLNESLEPGPVGNYLRGLVGGLDDFSGNDLSRSPKWKITLSGEYEVPIGRFGSLTPRVQYTWQDDTYFRVFNRDFDLQDDYHTTDAKLIWTSPEQRWTVEAFVQNIEDVAAKQNILIGPRQFGAPPFAWYNPPRFYGMQVGFRY